MAHGSLTSLLLLLAASAQGAAAFGGKSATGGRNVVPNSYILQVNASAPALAKRGVSVFEAIDHTLAAVKQNGVKYTIRQRFDEVPEAFQAVSIQVQEGASMAELAQIPGVQRVWPVTLIPRPVEPPVSDFTPVSSSSSPNSKRDEHNLEKRGTNFPPASAYLNDTFYPHVQTGIDVLHNKGILGQGVVVIDEGVDYTNPILGGCFGQGCQISFGYDFVGDNYTGTNTPVPDSDPFSSCSNHGTHTTGTVGALANEYGFSGAAPMATLGHYRVISCSGATTDEILVAALTRALQDKVNVVSMSLGSSVGWLDDSPVQIMASYLGSKGIHVVASVGNERNEGLFAADQPAASILGTGVGGVDPTYLPAYYAYLTKRGPVPYISPKPFNLPKNYLLYFTSTNTSVTNDACNPLPASTPDLSNRVVVVQRGTCGFTVKQQNVAAAGGKILLLYNSKGSGLIPQLDVGTTGLTAVGSLRYEDGLKLLSYYQSSPRGQAISFPNGPLAPYVSNTVTGGIVASYSNFGPTNELFIYPTLAAPGTNILSTVSGGVALMSGTSMAAPLVAGAYALLLSVGQNLQLSPEQAKTILMSTSDHAPVAYGSDTLDTVVSQGAGVINMTAALVSHTILSPSQFNLNDTQYLNDTQTLTLHNNNRYPVAYQLSWVDSTGIVTYNNGATTNVIPSTSPNYVSTSVLRVAFSQRVVTVPGGQTVKITADFIPPNLTPQQRNQFPIYSGYVTITGRGQGVGAGQVEAYSLPFFGLGARMIDMPVLDTTNVALGPYLPFIAVGQNIQTGPTTFSESNPAVVYFRLAAGTRRLRLDLVDASTSYNATVPAVTNQPGRLTRRSNAELVSRAEFPTLYSQVRTVGSLFAPAYWPPRDYLFNNGGTYSDYEITLDGSFTFPNGTKGKAELGRSYKVLLRALKITADPTYTSSYESWLSPSFTFTA
ncbi:subtilisin-like protease [Rhodotorula toruloides]|uniref:Subtilisin-like protease n=1 Tax=Rhodotorula toruloides TaxID=5286 RepID=A0A511KKJ3_RHOTO|nr:subtilisin-like protease [Rhodotorula toruloides]